MGTHRRAPVLLVLAFCFIGVRAAPGKGSSVFMQEAATAADFSTPATIASVFPAQGGNSGDSFLLTCPTGSYVTGFTGASGNLVEQVSLMCSDGSTLTPDGSQKSGKPFAYGSDSGFIGVSAITNDDAVEAVSFQGYDKKSKKYLHSPVYGKPGGKEHRMTCKGPERVIGIHGKHGKHNSFGTPCNYGEECRDYLSSFGVICGKPPCGKKGKDCEFPGPCSHKSSRKFKGGCFAHPCSGCSFGFPCEVGCPDHPCAGCPHSNPCDTTCPNRAPTAYAQPDVVVKDVTKTPTPGSAAPKPVARVTSNCPPGYYVAEGSKCVRCSPGTYSLGGGTANCNACKPGTYAGAGTSSSCRATAGPDEGASECSLCAPGTFSYAKAGQCSGCAAGTFANKPGSTQCTQCRAGTYAVANSTACEPCTHGYISEAGARSCTACGAGTFAERSANKCSTCPAGTFSERGSQECTDCKAGEYAEEGSAKCKACAAGTYSAARAASCATCPAGTYSDNGARECTQCAAGTYSATGAGKCSTCEAGTWSGGKAISCTACTAGTFTTNAAEQCHPCPAGTFSGDKAAACSSCPPHAYSLYPGATKCESCETLLKTLLQRIAQLETDSAERNRAMSAAYALATPVAGMLNPNPAISPINMAGSTAMWSNITAATLATQQPPTASSAAPAGVIGSDWGQVAAASTSAAAPSDLSLPLQLEQPGKPLDPSAVLVNQAVASEQQLGNAASASSALAKHVEPAQFTNYLAQSAVPASQPTGARARGVGDHGAAKHIGGDKLAKVQNLKVTPADTAYSMQAASKVFSDTPQPQDNALVQPQPQADPQCLESLSQQRSQHNDTDAASRSSNSLLPSQQAALSDPTTPPTTANPTVSRHQQNERRASKNETAQAGISQQAVAVPRSL